MSPEGTPTRRTFVQGAGAAVLSAGTYGRVRGANDRVGVGFIGYGLVGKRHLIDFRARRDVDCVAVAEVHRGRLAEAVAQTEGRAKGGSDFRRLLDDRAIHAVVVSTPDHWHALQSMLACAAGKDVYVEKPLTLFIREGRWVVDVARRHKSIVQVGTQQRSGPHYQRARDLLRADRIGRVSSVRMASYRNVMPGFGSPPDGDPPAVLDWDAWLGPAPARRYNPNRAIYHFRWFWDTAGGQMTNLAAHSLDIVHWALGVSGPTAVTSVGGRFSLRDNGETPDTQDTLIEYPGFTAVWSHREASAGPKHTPQLEFCGPKGTLAISRSGYTLTADPELPPETYIPRYDGGHPVGGPKPGARPATPPLRTEPATDTTGNDREQFRLHVADFIDCVKSRRQPISDVETGHRVATVCHLANISLRLGRKIRWDAGREEVVGDAEAARWLRRPYRAPWDRELTALGGGGGQ